jgi:transglutaminase-like putative cysteine protease
VILIIAILLFVFSLANLGYTLYKESQAKKITSVSFENDPIIEGKRFGGNYPIRYWAQPDDPAVKKLAEQFKTDDQMITVTKTYDWLEEKYVYTTDEMALTNHNETAITCGADTWLLPAEVIEMKEQKGEVKIDCEDSAVIASILEATGLRAYMNIGIVKITDLTTGQISNYGHGWPSVFINGVEYPLESTLGQPLVELKSGTVFYNKEKTIKVEYIAYVKFNLKEVIPVVTGVDINHRPDPLPPAKLDEIKDIWGVKPKDAFKGTN